MINTKSKTSGCIETPYYKKTLQGKRAWFKLPIGTKIIWLHCNPETCDSEYKIATIVNDSKGDWLRGDYAVTKLEDESDDELELASYGYMIKIYT